MAFKLIITYAALYVLSLSIPHVTIAQDDCVPPELDSFLEASRESLHFTGAYFPSPEAKTLCITQSGKRFKWLGVRWYGPEQGALFVLDNNDTKIATLPVGAVRNLRVGPRLLFSQAETVWVDYVAGQGTGSLLLKTALMTLSGDEIVAVWSHTILERNFVIPFEEGTEEEYEVTDSENGTITVTGILKTFPQPSEMETEARSPKVKKLEEETFCWFELIGRYTRCKARQ